MAWIISENPDNFLFTASDKEIAKKTINTRFDPLMRSSGLQDLIRPNAIRKSGQRSGDTDFSKEFAGGSAIIEGTNKELLDIKNFDVIPDRIEAGTYMCAAAICNKKLKINNIVPLHLEAVISKLEEMNFEILLDDTSLTMLPTQEIKPVNIITSEYPGFPTDMQAQFMALATQANGTSTIDERLFENRFMHVSELARMGADIQLNGNIATINGNAKLNGADVMATDLRASSALVLAAIVANGETDIHRIYHLDRGYEDLEGKLRNIGVNVKRFTE